jgi:mono/diheme cytochrome c family protein
VLVAIIRHGVEPFAPPGYQSTMPAFAETLDDTEIEAVLAYIKSQWPPEIRRRQERLNR